MATESNGLKPGSTWATALTPQGATMQMPVFLGLNLTGTGAYLLPYGAQIDLRGLNEVIRRTVSKRRDGGTVKEIWSSGDWEITLTGVLISDEEDDGSQPWPEDDVRELMKICQARQTIYINCQKTAAVGVDRMVITTYDLPHTDGSGNQQFRIVGLSDALYEPF